MEGIVTILDPLESLPLPDQLEKKKKVTFVSQLGYEPIQGCYHSCKLLYFLEVPWWIKLLNCIDLVGVDLDSLAHYHIT